MAEFPALVWICGPGFGCKAVRCPSARCSVWNFIHHYCQDQDVPVEYYFVKCNGALINTSDAVQHGAVYSLEPRLCGGKGGFGSMLRALGAQIEKTTNREACRDLSGRRLRDVNHEKAMAEWVKQQAEREAEKEQKRLERLQRKLAEPKHCFSSPDYQQQCHEMAERLEDSVLKGMQAASSKMVSAEVSENRKRPNTSNPSRGTGAEKRRCFWLGMDGLASGEASSSESSDDDSDHVPTTSGMCWQHPQSGSDSIAMAAEFPRSCHRAQVSSADSGSPEKLQKNSMMDSEKDASEEACARLEETWTEEQRERKVAVESEEIQEDKEVEDKEAREEESAGARLSGEEETKEAGPAMASGQEGGDPRVAGLEESQAGNTDIGQRTVNLLAFSSVAELELLGLDQLKSELMALGLKCGGTLQERAARLFSVRGLTRDQIDPALFAKPSKGKKK